MDSVHVITCVRGNTTPPIAEQHRQDIFTALHIMS